LVFDEAEEGGQGEHGEEAVEDGRAAHDDRHAVGGEEESGDERERGVAEEVVCEAAQEQHGDDAADGGRDAPADWVCLSEYLHAEGDEPLAGGWVDGVRGCCGKP